jgi:hypothetical protein
MYLQPVTLNTHTLNTLLQAVPANAAQSIKLVKHLAENPLSSTAEVIAATSATNLSNVASRVNNAIRPHGYFIACQFSPAASAVFQWAIYAIAGGAV